MRKFNCRRLLFLALACSLYACKKNKTIIFSGTAEVCTHYNCADATILQLTDQYFPPDHSFVKDDNRKYGAAWAEFLAFKYNVPLHVFEQSVKGSGFREFLNTGRGGASIYFPSCHIEYSIEKLNDIRDEIANAYGKSISTISYGCGKTNYVDQLPNEILGGRNSQFKSLTKGLNAITWYGDGRGYKGNLNFTSNDAMLSRESGGRYYTDIQRNGLTIIHAADYVKSQVSKTVEENGFYTNFMHWHDFYKNKNDSLIEGVSVMEPMFDAINEGIKNKGTNSGLDYNEAIEYLYAREAVDSIKLDYFDNKTLEVSVWKSTKRDRDYSGIDTPVTIKISKEWLKGIGDFEVAYSSQVLSAFYRKDALLLNIRLDFDETFETIKVDLDGANQILSLDQELHLAKDKQEYLTSNTEAKFVLFRRRVEAENFEIEIVDRTSSFFENYYIPKLEKGYHYFCGAIDRKRQSKLIEL